MQFWQLVKVNVLMLFRNRRGLFWTLLVPLGIYISLSVLPVGAVLGTVEYTVFLLPGVIALTVMQGGIHGLAYWTIDLRSRGVIKQISVAPLNKFTLVLSLLTARSLIMVLQAFILTLVGIVFFNVAVQGSIFWILTLVVMGGFVFLPIGLIISTLAKDYEAAAPITAAIALPLTFLGSVFYPNAMLPSYLQSIGQYLPITFLADGLRQVYMHQSNFWALSHDLFWLAGWIAMILLITQWRFKVED